MIQEIIKCHLGNNGVVAAEMNFTSGKIRATVIESVQ